MKKLLFVSLLLFASTLVANPNGGIKFKSDHHMYDKKYKNFNYKKLGYFDNYGYFFGYFDKKGYFYNNIYFLYSSKYTYRDRLQRQGSFKPSNAHYRKYTYTKGNDWNKKHKFRNQNEVIYGHYYAKNSKKNVKNKKVVPKKQYTKQNSKQYNNQKAKQYTKQKSNQNNKKYNNKYEENKYKK